MEIPVDGFIPNDARANDLNDGYYRVQKQTTLTAYF